MKKEKGTMEAKEERKERNCMRKRKRERKRSGGKEDAERKREQ